MKNEPDHARLKHSHSAEAIRARLNRALEPTYLKDFIYGAIDGSVTTFAIVAGVAGAGMSTGVIIVLGVANLIADGFSMAASSFLGTRAEIQAKNKIRHEEEVHIETYPEGEREEIRQIFASKGFEGAVLERITEVITADKTRWIETMLREEHGYGARGISAWRTGLATFVAFVLAGTLPLGSFVANYFQPGLIAQPFFVSTGLTVLAFLVIGAVKTRFGLQHWAVGAMETLFVGGLAAAFAFIVGMLLRSVSQL